MTGPMKSCLVCEYDAKPGPDGCAFPLPQYGGLPPFMVPAAMPDRRDGGAHCIQYQRAGGPDFLEEMQQ
jgi:hypothetical protein